MAIFWRVLVLAACLIITSFALPYFDDDGHENDHKHSDDDHKTHDDENHMHDDDHKTHDDENHMHDDDHKTHDDVDDHHREADDFFDTHDENDDHKHKKGANKAGKDGNKPNKDSQQKRKDGAKQSKKVKKPAPTSETSWICPPEWRLFEGDETLSCVWLSNISHEFNEAMQFCESQGATLVRVTSPAKDTFLKEEVMKEDGKEHWIGLSKGYGYDNPYKWHTGKGEHTTAESETLPSQLRDTLSYKQRCTYVYSYNEEWSWDVDDCDSDYHFICEKNIDCAPGTFGDKCDRECHCLGEPCDRLADPVSCKWGCQRGWMGEACDKARETPEVKYFCIDSDDVGRYAYVLISTKGIKYREIVSLTSDHKLGEFCPGTSLHDSLDDIEPTTIRIDITSEVIAGMESGSCVGKVIDDNTFSWDIVVQEYRGVMMDHDKTFHVTCNFSTSENLVREGEYSLDGEVGQVDHVSLTPETPDVQLQVVNAYNGEHISELPIGSPVMLQMKYGMREGSLVKGVIPYNCAASSPDRKHEVLLLDSYGCEEPKSPVHEFNNGGNNTLQTPWFNLFGFEGERHVVFRCSFHLCFGSTCEIGCQSYVFGRYRRDVKAAVDDGPVHKTTRAIRVLPSIKRQGEGRP